MRRKIVLAITIIVCFLLQCTVFKALAIASISPNLLIVVVASFGFMRGKKEGLFVGFFAGLLLDVMFGRSSFRSSQRKQKEAESGSVFANRSSGNMTDTYPSGKAVRDKLFSVSICLRSETF